MISLTDAPTDPSASRDIFLPFVATPPPAPIDPVEAFVSLLTSDPLCLPATGRHLARLWPGAWGAVEPHRPQWEDTQRTRTRRGLPLAARLRAEREPCGGACQWHG